MVHDVRYELRPALDGRVLQDLFSAAWGASKPGYEVVFEHSFTWVAAWANEELVGFVNVAWDGDVHFFLLDTTVHPEHQHRGIGQRLVEEAIDACRGHGEWLHVDADEALMTDFYERRCGFVRTPAGLRALRRRAAGDRPRSDRRPGRRP